MVRVWKIISRTTGVLLLIGGIYLAIKPAALLFNGVTVSGKVTEIAMTEYRHSKSYLPVVSFTDEQGKTQSFKEDVGDYPGFNLKAGDTVDVIYQKDQPASAVINTFYYMWGPSVLTLFLGVVFMLSGALAKLMKPMKLVQPAKHDGKPE